MTNQCPKAAELSAFVHGNVDEASADSIADHIEHCPACDATVVGLEREAATVFSRARKTRTENRFEEEPECQRLLAAASQLPDAITLESAPESSTATPPVSLRDYRILEKIGEGGMGAVYKALHTRLDRVVALKALPLERTRDEQSISRFAREMKAVGKLDHPNIVRAMDAGDHEGQHYLAMEFVQGVDLSKLVRSVGPLPVAEACEIIRQAAEGLQHAHEHGLVHRDIKPGNIMLTDHGQVKILDLGLALLSAQAGDAKRELTTTGQIMGTLDYMAPEQGGNTHGVDIRADLYALGATLYKLLTGEAPFAGEKYNSPIQKLTALATEKALDIRERRSDVPRDLAAIVERLLAKSPADRFATPAELAEAMLPFCEAVDLPVLAARATGRVAGPSKPSSASNLTRTSAKPQVKSGRSQTRWYAAAAYAGLAGLVLLAVLISIRTPYGEVLVELGEGVKAEDVKIEVSGNGQLNVADAQSGWTIDVKEGRYNVHLAAGQDKFDINRDQVVVTRDNQTRVKVTLKQSASQVQRPAIASVESVKPQPNRPELEPQVRPAKLPDEPRPFFVVSADGKTRGAYQFLSEAVSVCSQSDAIEIHANGPLVVGRIRLKDKSLALRSGAGYRPVLVPEEPVLQHLGWFLIDNGNLLVDGCDFRGAWPREIFRGSGDNWSIRNCRFLLGTTRIAIDARTGCVAHYSGPRLTVRDCLLSVAGGHTQGLWLFQCHGSGEYEFENNIACAVVPFASFSSGGGRKVHLVNNTLSTDGIVVSADTDQTEIVAVGNIFDSMAVGWRGGWQDWSKHNVTYQGAGNVFVGDAAKFVMNNNTKNEKTTSTGLADWRKIFNTEEKGSVEVPEIGYRWRLSWWLKDPIEIQTMLQSELQRLYTQNKSLAGAGPDWSLVGPGEAYVRALAAERREVAPGKLRPLAPSGGPVVLVRGGKDEAGFQTLQEALDAATEDGDVIEIRSDAQFQGAWLRGKPRGFLILRAAPGYRPIIDGLIMVEVSSVIFTLEGLDFRGQAFVGKNSGSSEVRIKRIANCSFAGGPEKFGAYAYANLYVTFDGNEQSPAEIVNCLIPFRTYSEFPSEENLLVRNSVVGEIGPRSPTKAGRLIFQNALVWAPGYRSGNEKRVALILQNDMTVHAQNTVFAAGPDGWGTSLLYSATDDAPKTLTWKGDHNIFHIGESEWIRGRLLDRPAPHDLSSWQEYWKSDADSIQLEPVDYDPQWWRLLPGSPGQGAGEGGQDIGADVDRVAGGSP